MTDALESSLEDTLLNVVRALGGKCIKLPARFIAGLPDRLILLPGPRIYFLELKKEGKKPRAIQVYWLELLRGFGFPADFVAGKAELRAWIKKNLRGK
jgi:hypothetical protein